MSNVSQSMLYKEKALLALAASLNVVNIQGESKKSGISKIMGISSFKYIRKGHIGGVLENSGYLLPDGH